MSFRIEEKIIINNNENDFIQYNKAKKIYKDRIVKSIYFDNLNYKIFNDSEEGVVPRKKIRIRNYNDSEINLLEIKISSTEGRYKKSEKISDNQTKEIIKNGYFDYEYGLCNPLLIVEYTRSYYQLFSRRLTLDSNIKYINFNNKLKKFEPKKILEIKTTFYDNRDELDNLFPFRRSRFSKYSEGFKALKIG